MDPYLDRPNIAKHVKDGQYNDQRYVACEMQGCRTEMEDRVSVADLTDDISYYAVFDGHAGSAISEYAAKNLSEGMKYTRYFCNLVEKRKDLSLETQNQLIFDGIKDALYMMDEEMKKELEYDRSGSTVVIAMITPDTIFLSNCGDSRGILVSKGKVKLTTVDHKPSNEKESERIHAAGGSVLLQRVNGSLAVSRSLGDFEYKRAAHLKPEQQLVSAEPDVYPITRTPSEDQFIVLACDGVWDVMTNDEVAQFVLYQLTTTDNLKNICQGLVDTCLNKGSRDNISVIIIFFPAAPKVDTAAQKLEAQLDIDVATATKQVLKEHQTGMDFTTLLRLVGKQLQDNGIQLPEGSTINTKREVIEKVWKDLHPQRDLSQQPNRSSGGFYRPKQTTPQESASTSTPSTDSSTAK